MPNPPLERRFLGMVEVDSGTLLVGDPPYCLPDAERGQAGHRLPGRHRRPGRAGGLPRRRPVLLLGRFGGDGTFPVYGEFDEDGEFLRATIEFVEPDEDDEGVDAED